MPRPSSRRAAALASATLVGQASRRLGRGGTALPGLVADRIDPTLVGRLASRLDPVVYVVGTNGKTTTTMLGARILAAAQGQAPITNASGSNLRQGVVSAIVAARSRPARSGIFEVDEFALGSISATVPPDILTATNLFRDQLDRFGEVDVIVDRWRRVLAALPPDTTLVFCVDDPRLADLAASVPLRSITFGASRPTEAGPKGRPRGSLRAADPTACPTCGTPLAYDWRTIAHLGGFRCPLGHVRRADPDLTVVPVEPTDGTDARIHVTVGDESTDLSTGLAGWSGAYDIGAAIATGLAAGIPFATGVEALRGASAAFGRTEWLDYDGRRVVILLTKNAASLTESIAAVGRIQPHAILFAVNDRPADGRDPAWIWDAGLPVGPSVHELGVAGSRAADLAIRVGYDAITTADTGATVPPVVVEDESVGEALAALARRAPMGATIAVVATYTAMLEVRRWLQSRHAVGAMPR